MRFQLRRRFALRLGHSVVAVAALSILAVEQAHAVLLDFTFADGARVDGTATAFDSGGTVGSYMTVGGVNLTMVSGFGAAFTSTPSSTAGQNDYSWNGVDYVASTTNYAGGTIGQLGISNPTIPGTNDSNNFNPQESWTINFSAPVIFRLLDADRIGGSDLMKVTIGASVFDFTSGDFVDDAIVDPFGPNFVIPAGTSITFLNSATYASLPLTGGTSGSGPPGGDVWGLDGFIVEVVPEPSCFAIMSLGMFGVAAMRRRQR